MLATDASGYHTVSNSSLYFVPSPDLIAREYTAFLNTKGTNDYGASPISRYFSSIINPTSPYVSWYFDSYFMTEKNDLSSIEEKASGSDIDICIQRKLQKNQWIYSLIPGREDYHISFLNNEDALNELRKWRQNPTAKEIRDYINNKIAEKVSYNSVYAGAAFKMRDDYHKLSYSFEKLEELIKGLTGDNSAQLQIEIAFDAKGCATSCLFDKEAKVHLLYFDHTVGPEGEEAMSDFASFSSANMDICAHLYQGSDYYRPEEICQTMIPPDPTPSPEMPSPTPEFSKPTDADPLTDVPAN